MQRLMFCALMGASVLALPAAAQDATADPALAARKLEADVATAEANARKAAADAAAAEVKAQTDAVNATLARVPGTDAREKAVIGEGAGKAEVAILSSTAMQNAAFSIAEAVARATDKTVVIVPSTTDPSLGKWQLYQLRRGAIVKALTRANAEYEQLDPGTGTRPGPAPLFADGLTGVVALGQAIGVAAKVGSYFQSEHQIRGYDLTTSETYLQAAVAEQLKAGKRKVQLLTRLGSRDAVTEFGAHLQAMDELAATASANLAAANAVSKPLRAEAAKPGNESKAPALLAKAKPYEDVAARLSFALDAYKGFLSDLSSADAKSAMPLGDVILERKLELVLNEGASILVVRPVSQSGSFYAKTNLWTFLGPEMPFRASGSAVASYTLTDRDDHLLAAGVFSEHTPYVHINKREAYPAKKTWSPPAPTQ